MSRRWTAKIEVEGVRLEATNSERDLMSEQLWQAIADVRTLDSHRGRGTIVLFKTTKARGTEADRMYLLDGTDLSGCLHPAGWSA